MTAKYLYAKEIRLKTFPIYFLVSFFLSGISFLFETTIERLIIISFLLFDYGFLVYHIKYLNFLRSRKNIILFSNYFISLYFIFTIIFIDKIEHPIESFSAISSILILSILLPKVYYYSIQKDEENSLQERDFWFLAAFYTYCFSTVWGDIFIGFEFIKNSQSHLFVIHAIIYLSWFLKYYLILKSAKCA